MSSPLDNFDATLDNFVDEVSKLAIESEDATRAISNLEKFSKIRDAVTDRDLDEEPCERGRFEKFKAWCGRTWDNETTRVLIKAGGAFAGVALVTHSTIKRDHVLERQALGQANQRS